MRSAFWRAVLAGIALFSLMSGAALAKTEPGLPPELTAPTRCLGFDAWREAEDARVVEAAIAAAAGGRWAALTSFTGPLSAVLDHAPKCFPAIEARGERLISRIALPPPMILAALSSAAANGRAPSLVEATNIYPTAAFLLGAYHVENGRYEEAIGWLDRGLALQPRNERLAIEKATALAALHRPAEAVTLLQRVLDDPLAAAIGDRVRLLRNLGVSLIDLGRLDDGEVALNESIRLEPDNPVAQNELRYIEELRAGAAPQPGAVPYTPGAAPAGKT